MTYTSLQQIEDKYAEPEHETEEARVKRLKSKNQAIRNFNKRQQRQQEDSFQSQV